MKSKYQTLSELKNYILTVLPTYTDALSLPKITDVIVGDFDLTIYQQSNILFVLPETTEYKDEDVEDYAQVMSVELLIVSRKDTAANLTDRVLKILSRYFTNDN